MKLRTKFSIGLLALAALCAVLFLTTRNRAQRELEATRRLLREQGFKIELHEFNLAPSPEEARRAAILVTTTRAALTNRNGMRPQIYLTEQPRLLTPAGPDTALVVWRLKPLPTSRTSDFWQELRTIVSTNQARLDELRQAAISGPIRIEPIGSQSPNPLLPHLAELKELVVEFSWAALLALHDGNTDSAWTNLLAATSLAAAYTPEPIEVSHLVRFACVSIAMDVTWNALQSGPWTEAQLAELQRRWECTDFWSGLPETAAYSRAEAAALCEQQRLASHGMPSRPSYSLRDPKTTWYYFRFSLNRLRYFHQGIYEDEKALLLYYRDRELELRRAIKAPTWAEMSSLPGVTNFSPPLLRSGSAIQPLLNLRSVSTAFHGQGQSLLSRAAETETRRRLLITAIALERFHKSHGSYPQKLKELIPGHLKTLPVDFMDGNPLRYRTQGDQYVLYSVGLDCTDNGGKMRQRRTPGAAYEETAIGPIAASGTDLVWPRPASPAEAERWRRQEQRAAEEQQQRADEASAFEQWSQADARQAQVETILSSQPKPMTKQPTYNHRPLAAVLANPQTAGTNQLKLTDLLALKQVAAAPTVPSPPPLTPVLTGTEPELVTFELPISYDALTNLSGELTLLVDPVTDPNSNDDCEAQQLECLRGTNGNCRLVWNTIYESPGKHALQVALSVEGFDDSRDALLRYDVALPGPVIPFVVSNLCQFSTSSATFQPGTGATFRARFVETNAAYTIEITSPAGEHVRTIKGSTSDGFMKVTWDLKDDTGNPCTSDTYNTTFHITLPDSGRTQTLKGP